MPGIVWSCQQCSCVQAELHEQKATNRKLEDRLMRACPPCEVRSQLRTQQQRVLVLLEEVETARAAACATQEVVQKYEREVHMLQRALSIHAGEFQRNGEDSVHSSLILALAEVRMFSTTSLFGCAAHGMPHRTTVCLHGHDGSHPELVCRLGKRLCSTPLNSCASRSKLHAQVMSWIC